jgi:hypothetical protein
MMDENRSALIEPNGPGMAGNRPSHVPIVRSRAGAARPIRSSVRAGIGASRTLLGMDQMLTPRQAFEATRRFRAQYNEREPVERRESIGPAPSMDRDGF